MNNKINTKTEKREIACSQTIKNKSEKKQEVKNLKESL